MWWVVGGGGWSGVVRGVCGEAAPGCSRGGPADARRGNPTLEEEVRDTLAGHFAQLVGGGRWDLLDSQKEAAARSNDRAVRAAARRLRNRSSD